MAERKPIISGKQLIKFMETLGYSINRQRGTLNDILTKVAIWNQIGKEKLIQMLKDY